VNAAARLEALLGPALAEAILAAVREELAVDQETKTRSSMVGFCSVAEAAVTLGVSRRQVYRQVHEGRLPSRRVGERIVIPRAALR